jgi:hypothetical protein
VGERRARVWAGIDVGKGHHWAAAVDETGATLWSKKVDNDESAILTAMGEILDLANEVQWAVDISGTSSALLLALLAAHGQQAVYVPGRTVNRMSGAYRGEAKTDARDAYVIAETARNRRDFATIDVPAQLAADLALLTAHRSDLVADRVRMINRLRDTLTGVFPALERAFDYSSQKGALVLLTGYQTPAALRRRGRARLTAWLANRGVRGADTVAATALEAAQAQQTALPGEDVAAQIVADLAVQILALDDRLKRIDQQIRETFRSHPQAETIESLPGMGPRRRVRRRRRRPHGLRRRRPLGLGGWPGASASRLRTPHRQSAPPQALQPPTAPGVLHVRADQHHPRGAQPGLLPQEARRGLQTRPGRHRSGTATDQRAVGASA